MTRKVPNIPKLRARRTGLAAIFDRAAEELRAYACERITSAFSDGRDRAEIERVADYLEGLPHDP